MSLQTPGNGGAGSGGAGSGGADPVFDLVESEIRSGMTVVEASAGTGKTYCLTGLVLRLLLEGKVDSISRLLVVTFTVAATEELVSRVRATLEHALAVLSGERTTDDELLLALAGRHRTEGGDDPGLSRLRAALAELDDLSIFTIHGFAKRVLDERAFESGHAFDQELLEQDDALLLRCAQDFWRHHLYAVGPRSAAVIRGRRLTPETFLEDFREWRQHPATVLQPTPSTLDEASRHLAETCDRLADQLAGDGVVSLRRRLRTCRYLSGKELAPEVFEQHLGSLRRLIDSGDAAGFEAAEALAGTALVRRVAKKEREALERHPLARACDAVALAADGLVHALRGAFLDRVGRRFEAEKERLGRRTFDDLLRRLDAALSDPRRGKALARALGDHYQAALIDEFQDTDLLQYRVFRRLFAHRPLVLIGDPKQAIYRFRGADVFAYMEARASAQTRYTLDRNWRSSGALVEAINTLFGAGPRPFVFEAIPFVPSRAAGRADETPLHGDGGRALEWLWLPPQTTRRDAEAAILRAVADHLKGLLSGPARLGDRAVEPGDVALLVRTNAQAQALRDALDTAGIPAILGRAGDVFLSEEMGELERLLAALADPRDSRRLRSAAATRLWGLDDVAVRRLLDDDRAWSDLVDLATELRQLWREAGFMPMMRRFMDATATEPRLLALGDGERRATNLLHAVELLQQVSHERHLSPGGLVAWLSEERRRHQLGLGSGDEAELRLESDERAVQIVTVHKSKGLEYEIVYCPFLWQGRPVSAKPPVVAHRDGRQRVFDFGGEDFETHRRQAEAERLAEDLRLAYVALTRARHRSIVVWGNLGRRQEAAASALAHLLHPHLMSGPGMKLRVVPGSSRFPQEIDDASWVEECTRLMATQFDAWRNELARLVEANPETMAFAEISASGDRELGASTATPPTLDRRIFPAMARGRLRPWRMASFTSLARSASLAAPDHRPALDHADPPLEAPLEAPGPVDPPAPATGPFAFARGARPGQCLHTLFEDCDLRQVETPRIREQVEEILARFGLQHAASHQRPTPGIDPDFDPVTVALELLYTVAKSEIPGLGFTLGEVDPRRRLIEWQFHLPLGGFRPDRLVEIFAPEHPDYALRLSQLGPEEAPELRGFLTGFVDLAFEHGGRWYLADWKSNHLGNSVADYGRPRLDAVMADHHYLLQSHLYTVALDRYLAHRQPGYSYDEHFGGVVYVFLRGLEATTNGADPATTGWWIHRPAVDRLRALDALLGDAPGVPGTTAPRRSPSTPVEPVEGHLG